MEKKYMGWDCRKLRVPVKGENEKWRKKLFTSLFDDFNFYH